MTTLAEPQAAQTPAAKDTQIGQRLVSVDALRGFDMFWIIGADSLVYALNRMTHTGPTTFLADQLEHVPWAGFHFYDLIFPLFVFVAGVSLVFSLTRLIETAGRTEALKRVMRRSILLFVVALFYSGGFTNPWPNMRLLGVLNRIALAYGVAGLLFCYFKPRALVGICIGLLAGYWALMTFVPIRDIHLTKSSIAQVAAEAGDTSTAEYFSDRDGSNPSAVKNSPAWAGAKRLFFATTNRVTGKFERGYNLSDHIDFQYLPGRKYDTFFDPEGFLSTLPAIATCLLGVFAGLLLRNQNVDGQRKVMYLVGCGLVAVALGWLWNLQFPVIKKIWTSSFVLVAGGYSAMLLGVFYLVVDVWQKRTWCQPFVWMGMNSITIYLANNIIGGFRRPAERLVGGDVRAFFDAHLAKGAGDMIVSITGLLLAFWFVRFLYRKKVFLRV
jgi:predicted acyltransferase